MFSRDVILGLIRHILTFGGGALVAKGYVDDSTVDQAAAALVVLIGIVWSAIDKQGR